MSKKEETCFDNMMMTTFRNTVVLWSMGGYGKVRDTISG